MQNGQVTLLKTAILLFLMKSSTILMESVLGTTGAMLTVVYLWQGTNPQMSANKYFLDKESTGFCFKHENLLLKSKKW